MINFLLIPTASTPQNSGGHKVSAMITRKAIKCSLWDGFHFGRLPESVVFHSKL